MTPAQLELIEELRAENAVIFSFMQAVITSHHSPRLLMDRFNAAHELLMSSLLTDPEMSDGRLARIEDQRRLLAARLEAHIQAQRKGAGADTA